jgi:hypothetical protein
MTRSATVTGTAGIGNYAGTITSIVAMTVLTVGVYILLRRRHWL